MTDLLNIVIEIKNEWIPIDVTREVSRGVKINITTHRLYKTSNILGVFNNEERAREAIAKRREQLVNRYGAAILEDIPSEKHHKYYTFSGQYVRLNESYFEEV